MYKTSQESGNDQLTLQELYDKAKEIERGSER